MLSELNGAAPEAYAVRSKGRLAGRPFARRPAGWERWQVVDGEDILIRHLDVRWLAAEFARHGIALKWRLTGQLSEAIVRGRIDPLHRLNAAALWSRRLARFAATNLLVFAASSAADSPSP